MHGEVVIYIIMQLLSPFMVLHSHTITNLYLYSYIQEQFLTTTLKKHSLSSFRRLNKSISSRTEIYFALLHISVMTVSGQTILGPKMFKAGLSFINFLLSPSS